MSMVTLGVRDLETARRFYLDGLGWTPALEVPDDVCFLQVGWAMLLGLWSREALSAERGGECISATNLHRSRWRTWCLIPRQ